MKIVKGSEEMAGADRVLPHNLEVEQAVLGAILLNGEAWATVAAILSPADFYRDAHRRIFEALSRMAAAGKAIDLITLAEALRASGDLDAVGGKSYLTSLVDGMPRAANVAAYAAIVRDKARLRSTVFVADKLMSEAYDVSAEPGAVLEDGVRHLLALSSASATEAVKASKAVHGYMEALDTGALTAAVLTGYADLDKMLGGFRPGQLVVLAARTSVGKTSLALGIASAAARRGEAAAYLSLADMSVTDLAAQLLSWRSCVPAEKLRRNTATAEEYARVSEAWAALEDWPLYLIDSARTLTQVAAWAIRMKAEHGAQLVVVDYLQQLEGTAAASREREVALVSRALKRLAMSQQVVVLALAQISRASESRTDKRPRLSDLRESGAIEQDTDVALLLYRDEMYRKKDGNEGIAEVIVAKNRTGPTGMERLYFDRNLARFSNLDLH